MTVELKTFISNDVLWSFIEYKVYKSKALWFSHSYEQPHFVTITCASQITSNPNICSGSQQRNQVHITGLLADSLHKRPVMWKVFPCDDIIMTIVMI